MAHIHFYKSKNNWFLFIAAILLSGIFGFANLSEFVTVGILKRIGGYPFGTEGPTPWYYKSARLYSTINLIFGLIFLITLSIAFWTFMLQKKKSLRITLLSILAIMLIQLISGQIA